MVTVAIVGILAAIALPSYRDYVLRGQLVDATNLLSAARANMERYFQDNRTYAAVGAFTPPCATTDAAPRTQGSFVMSCTAPAAPDANTYTLTATGSGAASGFAYTVTQADVRTTTIASPAPWPAVSATPCWIMKRGQTC